MNFQSAKGMKGTPAYMAPEILSEEKYSKSGDVYAFGFIVYEILSVKRAFENMNIFDLMKKVMIEGYRPEISEDIPDSFRNLIERCWSQNDEDRPTFNSIVDELKTNKEFITELTDELEYFNYIEFIDTYRSTFDVSKR